MQRLFIGVRKIRKIPLDNPAGVASWYGPIPPQSISTAGVQKSYGTKKTPSSATIGARVILSEVVG